MQDAIAKLIMEQLALTYTDAENHTEVLINAFDQEHKIVFWNKKAENYFGIAKEAAMGNRLEEVVEHAANNSKLKYLASALRGNPVHIARDKYDKRAAYYEQWLLPVQENGTVIAALNIVGDVK